MTSPEISPKTTRLEILKENLKDKNLEWNRKNLIAENSALNRRFIEQRQQDLGSRRYTESVINGIYTGAGREMLDDVRESLIPYFVEIFKVYSPIKPVKEERDNLARKVFVLEKEGRMAEARKVRRQIKPLRKQIKSFWMEERKNVKSEWMRKYKEGTKQVVSSAEVVGDKKVIEGTPITVPGVEARVVERWVRKMVEYGLSEKDAERFIRRSISFTKKVQEWQGASDNPPEGGLENVFLDVEEAKKVAQKNS